MPEESLMPLKPRDHQIAKSLGSSEILQVFVQCYDPIDTGTYISSAWIFCLVCVCVFRFSLQLLLGKDMNFTG